jgi:hypothetical protein
MGLFAALSINDIQHNIFSVIMLSVDDILSVPITLCRYVECRYAECHYAECRYAECHYAECRYADCRDYINVMLNVLMLEYRYAECRGAFLRYLLVSILK